MDPENTPEKRPPAEIKIPARVVEFPVGRLRPKLRSKRPERPVVQPAPERVVLPPVATTHIQFGRMKRSGQPLQTWTSPYDKAPPPPAKSEIVMNQVKTALEQIKSAARPERQEPIRLSAVRWASRLFARFRHSI